MTTVGDRERGGASAASSGTIAVGHYCEGAGHATRMLAVAEALADAGYAFEIAGGGPGEPFVEANGYTEHPLPTVDFIDRYQGNGASEGSLRAVAGGMSDFGARVRAYVAWLRELDPVAFVTDDFGGAVAATLARERFVYVSHDPVGFYETLPERASARLRNGLPAVSAASFCFPKVWSGDPVIEGAMEVGPMAPVDDTPESELPDVDVLVVPSAFSVDERELAAALAERDRRTTLVGGEDWELQPSLQPYVRAADLVVCSGYSTVMEAAVAGTPCVVLPETSEQRGVARAIADERGFGVAETIEDVLGHLGTLDAPVGHENGALQIADVVDDAVEG
ncbi:hypothetical protein GCM10028857_23930 [Salinarchaeum chitinilyticum]